MKFTIGVLLSTAVAALAQQCNDHPILNEADNRLMKTCYDAHLHGYHQSGLFQLEDGVAYCDQEIAGGGFQRVMRQVIDGDCGAWDQANEMTANPEDPNNCQYSVMETLEHLRSGDGEFEFILRFPNQANFPGYNHWHQTLNPATAESGEIPADFDPVHLDYTDLGFGGIQRASEPEHNVFDHCVGRGGVGSVDYRHFSIGEKTLWGTPTKGIPGPINVDASPSFDTELLVRTVAVGNPDDTESASCFDVYNHNHAAQSGLYQIHVDGERRVVECDMDREGGGWTRVFFHDYENCGAWDLAPEDNFNANVEHPHACLYSILGDLEHFRDFKGAFEFMMEFPLDGVIGPFDMTGRFNWWSQTNNPMTDSPGALVTDYTPLLSHQGWDNSDFRGIQRSYDTSKSVLDAGVGWSVTDSWNMAANFQLGTLTDEWGGILWNKDNYVSRSVSLWVRATVECGPVPNCTPTPYTLPLEPASFNPTPPASQFTADGFMVYQGQFWETIDRTFSRPATISIKWHQEDSRNADCVKFTYFNTAPTAATGYNFATGFWTDYIGVRINDVDQTVKQIRLATPKTSSVTRIEFTEEGKNEYYFNDELVYVLHDTTFSHGPIGFGHSCRHILVEEVTIEDSSHGDLCWSCDANRHGGGQVGRRLELENLFRGN